MNWEYKTMMFVGDTDRWIIDNLSSGLKGPGFYFNTELGDKLNQAAAGGWELYHVSPFVPAVYDNTYGNINFIFRRPVADPLTVQSVDVLLKGRQRPAKATAQP
jgi:hypothetical protein